MGKGWNSIRIFKCSSLAGGHGQNNYRN